MMKYFGIFLLLTTINLVLCMHLPHNLRLQRSSGDSLPPMEKIRYSNDWAVEIHGGSEMADHIARRFGFTNLGQIGNLKTMYHFQLDINDTVRQDSEYHFLASRQHGEWSQIGEKLITKSMQKEMQGMVGYAEQQSLVKYSKKQFTAPSDPEFRNQWSLLNTGQTSGPAGRDLNVVPAWMQGITGKGVVVSVVDDGLERRHSDLSPNFDSEASWDFVRDDGDPTPDRYFGDQIDEHGTSCAGEIGMAKSNGRCGAGVAHDCNLGGLKIDLSSLSDLQVADALGHNGSYISVYSNSWGPLDFGFFVDGPGFLTSLTLAIGAQLGRNGKGNVYVWAAGNGGSFFDSCAADGYVSSIYTIGVGAADQSGNQAEYDEECASKMVVTFNHNSNTFTRTPFDQVTTTTLNSRCTDGFTGTSAATPLVSGVVTLALQANPSLTWRDVQYLLAYTSDFSRLVNGDWRTNGAGLRVSHKHGFGAIDAEAMVTRAKRWINVPPQVIARISPSITSGTARRSQSLTVTFNVNSSNSNNITFLEHAVVPLSLRIQGQSQTVSFSDLTDALNAGVNLFSYLETQRQSNHPKRGDIRVELTSPQGTVSVLLPNRDNDFINDEGYSSWQFMSVHYWGEDPTGQWTLRVTFTTSSLTARVLVTPQTMRLYGTTETPAAVASIPSTCHPYCARGCSGPTAADCDVCGDYRLNSTLECVTACPHGTTEQNNYCFGTPIPATTSAVNSETTTNNPITTSSFTTTNMADTQTTTHIKITTVPPMVTTSAVNTETTTMSAVNTKTTTNNPITTSTVTTTDMANTQTTTVQPRVTDVSSSSFIFNRAYFLINMFSILFAVALVKILMVD